MQQLAKQVELHYLRTRPEEELQINKEKIYHYIQECVTKLQRRETDRSNKDRVLSGIDLNKLKSSGWKLFKFGSESDGTSLPSSDVDLAVHVNFRNSRKDKENLLTRLSSIISKKDTHQTLIVKLILHARYPIIKVFDIHTHCTFNISISDRYCYQRNGLIIQHIIYYNELYSKLFGIDECVRKLIVFIKHWSKARDINNAYHGYLNSFGFLLFALKYIKWFTQYKLFEINYKFWSLGEFIKGFFTFYVTQFNETRHSISILQHVYDEEWYEIYRPFDDKYHRKCVLQIVDPVNINHNITKNVGYNEFQNIKDEFIRATQIFEDHEDHLFDRLCKCTEESLVKFKFSEVFYQKYVYSKASDADYLDEDKYKPIHHWHWALKKVPKTYK